MSSTTYGQARAALTQPVPVAEPAEQELTPLQITAGAAILAASPLLTAILEGLL